jgi:hypothetical protein
MKKKKGFWFVGILFGLIFLVLFYTVRDIKETMWLQRELEICFADDTQIEEELKRYMNDKDITIARSYVLNASCNITGKCTFLQSIEQPYNDYKGAYFVTVLALNQNKDSLPIVKDKISEYLHIIANTPELDGRYGFDYGEDLLQAPKPIRAYVWALLYLDGINGYDWLDAEIDALENHQSTRLNNIRYFASIICWKNGSKMEKNLCLPELELESVEIFDYHWAMRFAAEAVHDGFVITSDNLVNDLEKIRTSSASNTSFREQWRKKTATYLLHRITGNKQYKRFFPSGYGKIDP